MANLGEFAAAAREVDADVEFDTFTLCGEEFRAAPEGPSTYSLMKFMALAQHTKENEQPDLAPLMTFIEQAVYPDDFERFEKVVIANRVSEETLMQICTAVAEAATGKGSSRSSDSQPGPSTTGESSRALSSSEASSTPLASRIAGLQAVPDPVDGVIQLTG